MQIAEIIINAIALGLPTLLLIYLIIISLTQEKKIAKLEDEVLDKDREIYKLQERIQRIKDVTSSDIERIVKENDILRGKVADYRQLRQLDYEASQRLVAENSKLYDKINQFKVINKAIKILEGIDEQK